MIFSCFTKKLKEKVGGLLGAQRVCWPLLKLLGGITGGGGMPPRPPLPTPMKIFLKKTVMVYVGFYPNVVDSLHKSLFFVQNMSSLIFLLCLL